MMMQNDYIVATQRKNKHFDGIQYRKQDVHIKVYLYI